METAGDFLNLLRTYMLANGLTNVFSGIYPSEPDNCIALLGLTNGSIGTTRDIPDLQFPRFQVVIRNTSYETGSETLQTIRTLLHGEINLELPTNHAVGAAYLRILKIFADQEGGSIGQDEKGLYEFSINFSAEMHYVAAA